MEFISSNVIIDENTGCWNWQKSLTSAGYGQFTINGKYWLTHRYVYTITHGEIPDKMLIRHLCHNTKCCNPAHLCVGTNKDNWWDSETIHRVTAAKRAKGYIVNNVKYRTMREAKLHTGISCNSLNKYTDKKTRVFDVKAYRKGTYIAGWVPKV